MLKPTCSNCSLYKVPCSTTIVRRRPAPAPVPPKETSAMSSARDGNNLEARLARIEAKLDRIGNPSADIASGLLLAGASGQAGGSATSSFEAPSNLTMSCRMEPHGVYTIPALTEILPVIDDYFRDFNSALPLFRQSQFTEMLYDFYSEREQTKKSRAVWAAINVVLALGYRIRIVETDDIAVGFDDKKVKKCIDSAQRELDELVTREEDTLGIQVLLGLVSKYLHFRTTLSPYCEIRGQTALISLIRGIAIYDPSRSLKESNY